MSNIVEIYTDGACIPNPGPGGYAAILRYGEHEKIIQGNELDTTNNRMELLAVIMALKQLKRSSQVKLYTDSNYVRLGITKWIYTWAKNAWRTSSKQAVKNQDLWQELADLVKSHQIEWIWVKGHSGHFFNEKVDSLANTAARSIGKNATDNT